MKNLILKQELEKLQKEHQKSIDFIAIENCRKTAIEMRIEEINKQINEQNNQKKVN